MSSPVNNFLSLIPAVHRVAVISPFSATDSDESIVPVVQKSRRSSSTATADSNTADEPVLPSETAIVESPTEDVDLQTAATEEAAQPVVIENVGLHRFLRLGN
jgi:hypothetical protein